MSSKGYRHTPEARKKISETRKRLGLKPSAEALKRSAELRRGQPISDRHREILSVKMKGRIFTPEWKAKISAAKKGRPNLKLRGRQQSPEVRAKISAANKGKRRAFSKSIFRIKRQPKRRTQPEVLLHHALLAIGEAPETDVFLGFARTRPDFCFPEIRFAIYVDGRYWHTLPKVTERDAAIERRMIANGWAYIRIDDESIKRDAGRCARLVQNLKRNLVELRLEGISAAGGLAFGLRNMLSSSQEIPKHS